jgi:hypothetical protein
MFATQQASTPPPQEGQPQGRPNYWAILTPLVAAIICLVLTAINEEPLFKTKNGAFDNQTTVKQLRDSALAASCPDFKRILEAMTAFGVIAPVSHGLFILASCIRWLPYSALGLGSCGPDPRSTRWKPTLLSLGLLAAIATSALAAFSIVLLLATFSCSGALSISLALDQNTAWMPGPMAILYFVACPLSIIYSSVECCSCCGETIINDAPAPHSSSHTLGMTTHHQQELDGGLHPALQPVHHQHRGGVGGLLMTRRFERAPPLPPPSAAAGPTAAELGLDPAGNWTFQRESGHMWSPVYQLWYDFHRKSYGRADGSWTNPVTGQW